MMSVTRNDSSSQLDADDLNRIHRVLRKRFRNFDGKNIQNISFGQKDVDGNLERCVRFWVKKKRTPRRASASIPKSVKIRLWQAAQRQYVEVDFITDVVAAGKLKPTGEYLAAFETLACSTGLAATIRRQYGGVVYGLTGLLTVAHPFIQVPAHSFSIVAQGRTINGITGANATGRMRYRTFQRRFDAAFVEFDPDELQRAGYFVDTGIGRTLFSESEIYQLASNQAQATLIGPGQQLSRFFLSDYIPVTLEPIEYFGHLRGLLLGSGTRADFPDYSSGSSWTAFNRPLAMQIGYQRTENGEEYGLGQATFAIFEEWLGLQPDAYEILNVF